jgi:hypothetical protein
MLVKMLRSLWPNPDRHGARTTGAAPYRWLNHAVVQFADSFAAGEEGQVVEK